MGSSSAGARIAFVGMLSLSAVALTARSARAEWKVLTPIQVQIAAVEVKRMIRAIEILEYVPSTPVELWLIVRRENVGDLRFPATPPFVQWDPELLLPRAPRVHRPDDVPDHVGDFPPEAPFSPER